MGRPSSLTEERIEQVAKYLRLGLNRADAAALSGFGRHAFMDYINKGEASVADGKHDRYAAFVAAVEIAEAEFKANAHGVIINAANQGQWTAAMTLLERRFPNEYSRRTVEVTGRDGGPIEVRHSVEDLIAQVKALRPETTAIEANGSKPVPTNGAKR